MHSTHHKRNIQAEAKPESIRQGLASTLLPHAPRMDDMCKRIRHAKPWRALARLGATVRAAPAEQFGLRFLQAEALTQLAHITFQGVFMRTGHAEQLADLTRQG